MTVRISRNLDTNTRMEVNDTVVKQAGKFIYLGSEKYYEGKINGEINKKYKIILNSIKL